MWRSLLPLCLRSSKALAWPCTSKALQSPRIRTLICPLAGGPRLMTSLTLSAGTFVLLAIAAIVHRFGVGNGLSILLAGSLAPLAFSTLTAIARALDSQELAPLAAFLGIVVLVLPAIATYRLARLNAGRLDSEEPASLISLPAGGLVPIESAASLMLLPVTLANLGLPFVGGLNADSMTFLVIESVLVVVLCILFSVLFHLPANLKRVSADLPTRTQLLRASVASAGYLLVLVLASHVALRLLPPGTTLTAVSVAIMTAVVLDVLHELSAPAGRISIWPIHQLYSVQVAAKALRQAGIEFHLRGLHHRTLLQFYGPYVPVEVYAAPEQAEQALGILKANLLGGSPVLSRPHLSHVD